MLVQTGRRRALLLLILILSGCESGNQRLVELADAAQREQARQNQHLADQSASLARQSQELATAAHTLVEQDATSRREMLQAQNGMARNLDIDRAELEQERRRLDNERRAAARAVVSDPVIAQAVLTVGLTLAGLLPLLLTGYALRCLPESLPPELWLEEFAAGGLGGPSLTNAGLGPRGCHPAPSRPAALQRIVDGFADELGTECVLPLGPEADS
jgi:hypothetical protein